MSRKWIENPICSWSYCLKISPSSLPNERGKEQAEHYIFLKHRTLAHSKHSPVAAEVHRDSGRGQVALVGSLSPHIFSGLETLAMSGFMTKGIPLVC